MKMVGNPPFIRINNIGSRSNGCAIFNLDKGIFVQCGCVFCSLEDFKKKVKKTHGDNKYARQYFAAIDLAKITFEKENK